MRWNNSGWWGLVLLIAISCMWSFSRSDRHSTQTRGEVSSTPVRPVLSNEPGAIAAPTATVVDAGPPLTPEQHLRAAIAALGPRSSGLRGATEANAHLQAIPGDAGTSMQHRVERLLKEIDQRTESAYVPQREAFADRMFGRLLDARIHVDGVRAAGPNKDVLTVEWSGCDHVATRDFDDHFPEIRSLHFHMIRCVRTYSRDAYTLTFNAPQR